MAGAADLRRWLQKRDFISVYDVAAACRLALETNRPVANRSTSRRARPMTVKEIAARTIRALGPDDLEPEITGKISHRRHSPLLRRYIQARDVLGWEPRISLEQGLEDLLIGWKDRARPTG